MVRLWSLAHLCTAKEGNCLCKYNSAKHRGWSVVGRITSWSAWLLILTLRANRKNFFRSKSQVRLLKQKWHFVEGGES